jgi:hypothetical protein
LQMKFIEAPLDVFWIWIRKENPVISAKQWKYCFSFQLLIFVNKFFHVCQILKAKAEIICFLSRKNCEYVSQYFSQEFNICAKRNKLDYHTKSKLYYDFGCQLRFDG